MERPGAAIGDHGEIAGVETALVVVGAFLLVLYIYIPYNTFGEDVKMYKDSGMMTIMVLAILVALWTASVSVADEIEGRTALTLLSKPISRRQFVIGKFLGIVWPIVLMFVNSRSSFWLCQTSLPSAVATSATQNERV